MKICKVYLAVMMLVSALIVSSCSGGNKQTEKETAANTEYMTGMRFRSR